MGGVRGRKGYWKAESGSRSCENDLSSSTTYATLDFTAHESLEPTDILLRMVRIHFICRISSHEMQNGQWTSWMLVCPSRQVENVIFVDDKTFTGHYPLLEL